MSCIGARLRWPFTGVRGARAVTTRPRVDAVWPVAGGYPMIDGAMVLVLALAVLAVLWVIVIYGSQFLVRGSCGRHRDAESLIGTHSRKFCRRSY